MDGEINRYELQLIQSRENLALKTNKFQQKQLKTFNYQLFQSENNIYELFDGNSSIMLRFRFETLIEGNMPVNAEIE